MKKIYYNIIDVDVKHNMNILKLIVIIVGEKHMKINYLEHIIILKNVLKNVKILNNVNVKKQKKFMMIKSVQILKDVNVLNVNILRRLFKKSIKKKKYLQNNFILHINLENKRT